MKTALVALASLLIGTNSSAVEFTQIAPQIVGWRIIDVVYVEAFTDRFTKAIGDFRGCIPGRVIIYDEGKSLVCSGTYQLKQAVRRPRAVIIEQDENFKMIVDNVVYDME